MKRIEIKVKTNARHEAVTQGNDGLLCVAVNAPPRDGAANAAIIEILARYFGVPKSKISIKTGQRSKTKLIEIFD